MPAELNPYESPRVPEQQRPPQLMYYVPKTAIRWRVVAPAFGLLALSILHVLPALLWTVAFVAENLNFRGYWRYQRIEPVAVIYFLFLPATIIILLGMHQMLHVRNLTRCRVAAILACIPFLTPLVFVGIPFGIWAVIVLYLPSTAAEFERVKHPVPAEDLPVE